MGLILGRVTHILWPFERMGRIGKEGWKGRTRVVKATEEEVDKLYMELHEG